jgi:hypothetical protein
MGRKNKVADVNAKRESRSLLDHNVLFNRRKRLCIHLAVSLFWPEKLMMLIQLAQLFYLILAANFEQWPNQWTGSVKYGSPAILDFTCIFYEEIVEDPNFRVKYGGIWVASFIGLAALYLSLRLILVKT